MSRALCWLLLILLLVPAGGCEALKAGGSSPALAGKGKKGDSGRYYGFSDIRVPSSLNLQKDQSLLFHRGRVKAGVLVFSERVEVASLIHYFLDAMAKDNWKLQGTFKYPRVALFFAKPRKICVINIKEGTFSTKVEIWVAPSLRARGR